MKKNFMISLKVVFTSAFPVLLGMINSSKSRRATQLNGDGDGVGVGDGDGDGVVVGDVDDGCDVEDTHL